MGRGATAGGSVVVVEDSGLRCRVGSFFGRPAIAMPTSTASTTTTGRSHRWSRTAITIWNGVARTWPPAKVCGLNHPAAHKCEGSQRPNGSQTRCVGALRAAEADSSRRALPLRFGRMGWCQEFGAEIQAGCDHAMVAAADHCFCPECGTDCRGKFDACAEVWAAGASNVELSRPTQSGTSVAALDSGLSTRSTPLTSHANGSSHLGERLGASTSVDLLHKDLDHLRAEVGTPPQDGSGDALLGLLNAIPDRISMVIAEAMRMQHRQFLDAGDRLTEVLARRVGEQIAEYDAEREGDARSSFDALADLITEQSRQIDALLAENQRLSKEVETQGQFRAVQEKLDAALAAMTDRP